MTSERWGTFEKRFQLLTIGAEFERARVAERDKKFDHRRQALERAIALIDLTLEDERWRNEQPMFEGLRSAAQEYLTDDTRLGVAALYQAL